MKPTVIMRMKKKKKKVKEEENVEYRKWIEPKETSSMNSFGSASNGEKIKDC